MHEVKKACSIHYHGLSKQFLPGPRFKLFLLDVFGSERTFWFLFPPNMMEYNVWQERCHATKVGLCFLSLVPIFVREMEMQPSQMIKWLPLIHAAQCYTVFAWLAWKTPYGFKASISWL